MTRSARSVVLRSALALACAGALAIPVATSATAEPDDDSPSIPGALIDALSRDLGLSEQQAQDRLESEATASRLMMPVQELLGTSFAGSWFNPATEHLTVATTDPAAVDRIEALGADAKVVTRSARQLADRKAALDAKAPDRPAAITGWYVDPVRNNVVVSTTSLIDGMRFGGPGAVIEQVTERPRLLADLNGGAALNSPDGVRCSIGFTASAGLSQYVITAGHCTAFGGKWIGSDGSEIGRSSESTYPDNDFGLVRLNSIKPLGPQSVIGAGRVPFPITGTVPAPIGASVCRSGATTGWVCGTILGFDQSVSYERDVVNGLVKTSACAELGDSGGPFVAGTEAQGVLSGGIGTCGPDKPGETYFQPINEILDTYNLKLRIPR